MLLTSTIQVIYLFVWKPFEEPLRHRIEIFNEFTAIALSYVLMCFSPANQFYVGSEFEYDISFVVIICANILVHLGLLCWDSFITVKEKIKEKCCKKKQLLKTEAAAPKQKAL